MNKLKYNKTNHKTHFILGTNSYMFRHLNFIFRDFKDLKLNTNIYSFVCPTKFLLSVLKVVNSFCLLGICKFCVRLTILCF
jgi:hypothetical protein